MHGYLICCLVPRTIRTYSLLSKFSEKLLLDKVKKLKKNCKCGYGLLRVWIGRRELQGHFQNLLSVSRSSSMDN